MPCRSRMPDNHGGRTDATGLLHSMRQGKVTALEVVSTHLDRLQLADDLLNAAVCVFRDEATQEARNPRPGPLSGLPVSIKETFGLRGQYVTAGSIRMEPLRFEQDAVAVTRLKAAGAIVVARTNVPEFAMAGETDNLRYGRTRNPLDPERTCGGSSGGEAAIVASGGSAAGLGSDILGSIRIPASFCGLVGFKPASQSVSKAGSWPQLAGCYTDSWLCAGPITRSVRDARLMYQVLSGEQIATGHDPGRLRLIQPAGFPLSFRSQTIPAAVDAAKEALASAGMRIQPLPLGNVRRWYHDMVRFLGWELLPLLEGQLTETDGRRLSLRRELLRRWRGRGEIYPGLLSLIAVGRLSRFRRRAAAMKVVERFELARRNVYQLLGEDGVLLLPTLGTLAPRHGEMNRLSFRPGVNKLLTPLTLCNYLNLPAVTVPAWRMPDTATGLPPGVMLVARPGSEAMLLDVAERMEASIGLPPSGSE